MKSGGISGLLVLESKRATRLGGPTLASVGGAHREEGSRGPDISTEMVGDTDTSTISTSGMPNWCYPGNIWSRKGNGWTIYLTANICPLMRAFVYPAAATGLPIPLLLLLRLLLPLLLLLYYCR